MSMQILTIVQFVVILCIYTFLVVIFPAAIFGRRFEGKPLSVRFMAYITIGNFYIMNLVFILELMHISCIYTLIAGTVIPVVIAIVHIYSLKPKEAVVYSINMLLNCMRGTVGVKFIIVNILSFLKKKICPPFKRLIFRLFYSFTDFLCTVLVIVVVLYSYGTNMISNYGYCASDLVVHNYWINELGKNNIFVAGVYPFGFHCVIYYIHEVFCIDTYVILRVFCIVQTIFIHLVLLSFIRACCKSRYIPYITVVLFATFPLIQRATYIRYVSALPQEFGIIFILPSIYFLFEFFRVRKKELSEENLKEDGKNIKRSWFKWQQEEKERIKKNKLKRNIVESKKRKKWKKDKRNKLEKGNEEKNEINNAEAQNIKKESKNNNAINNIEYNVENSIENSIFNTGNKALDDSLAVCRNIKKRRFEDEVYQESADKIFEDINKSINRDKDERPWERVLDEILYGDKAIEEENDIKVNAESNHAPSNEVDNGVQVAAENVHVQSAAENAHMQFATENDNVQSAVEENYVQTTDKKDVKSKIKAVFSAVSAKCSKIAVFLKIDSNIYLTLFAMCFSMTLAVHFYGTMVAGLCCIGVAVGYFFRLFRKGYFGRVMLAGIAGIVIAVLPMFIAYLGGTKLQGSLGWGMEIIMGNSSSSNVNTYTADSGDNSDTSDDLIDQDLALDNNNYSSNAAKGEAGVINSRIYYLKVKIVSKVSRICARLSAVANCMAEILNEYVIECGVSWKENLAFLGIIYTFVLGVLLLLKKEKDYGSMIISVVIGILFMITILCASEFGIPALMDKNRSGVYTTYLLPVIFAFGTDGTIWLLFSFIKQRWAINVISLIVSAAILVCVCMNGLIREPCVFESPFETNAAITCLTNIIRENDDETFTIISANDEMQMLDGHGYHYETIQFLRDMDGNNYEKTLTIPTKKIYFFIEKIPIDYSVTYKNSGQLVSAEGASYPLIYAKGLGVYMGQNRWIVMSRMYYWAMAFKRAYGKELKVYYEDDGFVCFEIEQNPYRLYDLSIDYWFNTQLWDLR